MPSAAGSDPDKYSITLGQYIGNYRIERLLDEGGMGAVFAAVHKDIGRKAAVKVLMRDYARDPEFATRFLNEARAVNLIAHPGVVEIFEFGRLPDETPYIIMEYLSGESLAKRIAAGGRRGFRTSFEWCRQIAVALCAAHKRGIVHRDLKPENIFLCPDALAPTGERVKVLDFGIAKFQEQAGGAKSPSGQPLTREGATLGSPLYMSPEQCYEMGAVTDRADVYSLGIILYELLTGRTPFTSRLPMEVMVMHVKNTPPPLRQLNPTVPAAVVALVDRMLLKEPTQRPSMEEVAQRLEELMGGMPGTGGWQRVPGRGTLGRPLLIGGGLLVVGLLAGGAVVLSRRLPPPAVTAPPPPRVVTAPPVPQPAAPAPPPPSPPATIRYELASEPPGAHIVDLDTGEELGTTPAQLELARSDRPQRLVLRRPGYQERGIAVDRRQDGKSSQKLAPLPRRPRPSADHSEDLLAPKL